MKNFWIKTFRRLVAASVIVGASAFSSAMTYAATIAFDTSTDPAYDDGWQAGDNGGFGFGAWDFTGTYNTPVGQTMDIFSHPNDLGRAWTLFNADAPPGPGDGHRHCSSWPGNLPAACSPADTIHCRHRQSDRATLLPRLHGSLQHGRRQHRVRRHAAVANGRRHVRVLHQRQLVRDRNRRRSDAVRHRHESRHADRLHAHQRRHVPPEDDAAQQSGDRVHEVRHAGRPGRQRRSIGSSSSSSTPIRIITRLTRLRAATRTFTRVICGLRSTNVTLACPSPRPSACWRWAQVHSRQQVHDVAKKISVPG